MKKGFLLLVLIALSVRGLLPAWECGTQQPKYYLAACAVFRDEAFFLKEWLEYHLQLGVEHFYLYNNLSQDNYKEILEPYVQQGLVDLYNWPIDAKNQKDYLYDLQIPAYQQALEIAKKDSQWIAFIDLDEFIVPLQQQNLPSLLKPLEKFAGLAINWQVFGTSNFDEIPPGKLLIESLTWKAESQRPINQFVKLIVQPALVKQIIDPHCFEYADGCFAVSSSQNLVPAGYRGQTITIEEVQLNHYWFGTKNWFLSNKLPRRKCWGVNFKADALDEIISSYNKVEDKAILRFVPQVKQAIKDRVSAEKMDCDAM